MWSKFKYFIHPIKPRLIIVIVIAVIFLGVIIYTNSSKATLSPTVYRIAIDETWPLLNLYDKEQYISAFSEDLLRTIAAQQHFSVQLVRVRVESTNDLLEGLDKGE